MDRCHLFAPALAPPRDTALDAPALTSPSPKHPSPLPAFPAESRRRARADCWPVLRAAPAFRAPARASAWALESQSSCSSSAQSARCRIRLFDLRQHSFRQQLPAEFARTRPQVEQMICRAQNIGVVLHHQDRIAQVAQLFENMNQPRRSRAWVCNPIDGSSSTYSAPTSRDPSEVAS